MRVVFSSERKGDIRGQLGGAHYSYRFVEAAFRRAFVNRDIEVVDVDLPEMFKDEDTCNELLGAPACEVVHIAFRSTENLRALPGACNISHFAWEFDVMKDHGLAWESITANQVHMLGLMDEVWVQCAFTRDILSRYGLPNVHIIPAPLIGVDLPERSDRLQAWGFLKSLPVVPLVLSNGLSRDDNVALAAREIASLGSRIRLTERTKIFLTICNPHDLRKNLLNLIEGFQMAAGDEDFHLIVKLLIPNNGNFHPYAPYDSFAPRHHGPAVMKDHRVHLLVDYLTDDQMRDLYSLADFYVSASHCEGLNMPLVEAMSHGTIPVTTRNTAMLDYIDIENAVLIDERSVPALIKGMAGDVSGQTYAVNSATRFDIARALSRAVRLRSQEREALSSRGRATVGRLYGELSVMTATLGRLSEMRPARIH